MQNEFKMFMMGELNSFLDFESSKPKMTYLSINQNTTRSCSKDLEWTMQRKLLLP